MKKVTKIILLIFVVTIASFLGSEAMSLWRKQNSEFRFEDYSNVEEAQQMLNNLYPEGKNVDNLIKLLESTYKDVKCYVPSAGYTYSAEQKKMIVVQQYKVNVGHDLFCKYNKSVSLISFENIDWITQIYLKPNTRDILKITVVEQKNKITFVPDASPENSRIKNLTKHSKADYKNTDAKIEPAENLLRTGNGGQ